MSIEDDKYDPLWRKAVTKKFGEKCIHCNSTATTRAHLIGRNNRKVRFIVEDGRPFCHYLHRYYDSLSDHAKKELLKIYIEDGELLFHNLMMISRGMATAKDFGYEDVRDV